MPARVSPARACAHRVLRRVSQQGAYADRALRAEAAAAGLEGRERAFARALVYGAAQRRRTLDHVIGELSGRPVEQIDPPLLDVLRLGVLQLVFLDGVADHAAVDQAVELAKGQGPSGGHRLANAVLRRAAVDGRPLVEALPERSPREAALRHSHPDWVAELWFAELGPVEARRLMAAGNTPPEVALRANGLLLSRLELGAALAGAGVAARPALHLPEGVVLDAPLRPPTERLLEAGALMPQSRGSMIVARALDPRPGERALDLCAAPGAKTTHLAALAGPEAQLVAVERHPGRARELAETCKRMRAPWVEVVTADAERFRANERFDRVLLDPPCSDLGTLQARPDARWRKSPEAVRELAALQRRLLDAAVEALAPGGTLVYSVCTISAAEAERQVEELAARRPDLAVDDLGAELPAYRHSRDERFLQLLPHRHRTSGFFIARVRRRRARSE